MERTLLIFVAFASIFLSACSSTGSKPVDNDSLSIYQQKVLEENQRTQEVLAKAATLSAKSLAVFVRTNQALKQKEMTAEQIRQARFQNNYVPVNMEQKIKYAWDNAPEPLIRMLAANSGYEVKYKNERPPITKSVTVNGEPRMIVDYFDIIESQAEGYIKDIDIDDKHNKKIITVIYEGF